MAVAVAHTTTLVTDAQGGVSLLRSSTTQPPRPSPPPSALAGATSSLHPHPHLGEGPWPRQHGRGQGQRQGRQGGTRCRGRQGGLMRRGCSPSDLHLAGRKAPCRLALRCGFCTGGLCFLAVLWAVP